ncbi:hypothetical protein BD779DRAFT_1678924 [Infundibulicybe gibba]|nr:hypothetical protein BD779DRAFT_1678924 [Infundibulicybe gibba]
MTNRAPTDSEVAHSRDIIDSAKKKLSPIQAAMDDLAEQAKDILRLIEAHKTSTSSLKTFPPEILVAIFIEYMNIVVDPWTTSTSPESPLVLMWICSRWRGIILDTPQSWTKISSSTPMVNFWLNQSKELPLDLELNLSSGDVSVLDALIPHAHRWERADLVLQSDSNSKLSPVKGRLQSLKRLEILSVDATGFLDFCEGAPQLTELWLKNDFDAATIMLPWEQLQVCTLPGTAATLYALEHAKNIRTCHLDVSTSALGGWMPMHGTFPQLHCPSLNTLIICWRPGDYRINSFFSSLTLPSLQHLEVRLPPPWGSWSPDYDSLPELGPTSSFLEFFERSSSHLSVLTLSELPASTAQLIDYLTFMPSLTSLDIKHTNKYVIEDEFLQRLTLNHANHLLPRLSALSIRGQAEFCEGSLDALIVSRRNINPQDVEVSLLKTSF